MMRRQMADPLMDKKICVGVIGIGFGQQVHIPAFRSDARCDVTAICASTFARAQSVADRLQVPKAYGDWRQMLADPKIEAIAVATPPALQATIVMEALAKHKHVFCEKPLATARETAREMLEAACEAGLAHMVDFEFPEIEAWRRAKEILDSGSLGRVRHGVVSWQVETYVNRVGLKSWKSSPEDSGGALNLFVSHTFQYLEWLLGPIRNLSARLFSSAENRGQPQSDTLAVLCLEHANGTPVSVSVSSGAFLGTGHRVEIYGDEGSLVLDNPTSDYVSGFRLLYGTRKTARLETVHTEQPGSTEDGRVMVVGRLVERFANWIRDGIPGTPNLEDGYRVQCLLDAAHRAHKKGTQINVSCNQV
ncbi:Gfo/Idh/MocA family oxidoreductase [Acidobacteria bacterium AH-259-O06]|nr:Gfo/Idh/MocA family oxidoreductase [Acidobacteria bacterium AH-259-O06]